jgi:hypothetical protein
MAKNLAASQFTQLHTYYGSSYRLLFKLPTQLTHPLSSPKKTLKIYFAIPQNTQFLADPQFTHFDMYLLLQLHTSFKLPEQIPTPQRKTQKTNN